MKGGALAGMVAALALSACHAERRTEPEPRWNGLTLHLTDSPSHALSTQGLLHGAPVEVRFEVARALSTATQSCFGSPGKAKRVVRVPLAAGGFEAREEAELPALKLGAVELTGRRVAKVPEGGACVVTLGEDVLGAQAFELDLERGVLHFVAPGDRSVGDGASAYLVELSRDPRTDFLLLPVGLRGANGEATLAPFVVSLGLETSVLSRAAARKLGAGNQETFTPSRVELVPGLMRSDVDFSVTGSWRSNEASGILGRDVWRGMRVLVDIPALRILAVPGATFKAPREVVPERPRAAGDEEQEPGDPGHSKE